MSLKEELPKDSPNQWRIVEQEIMPKIYKRNFKRICKICGRNFNAAGNSSWCGFCSLEFKCNHCNKWVLYNIAKLYTLNFNVEYGCNEYCHFLGAKKKMSKGICSRCGQTVEKRDQFCLVMIVDVIIRYIHSIIKVKL